MSEMKDIVSTNNAPAAIGPYSQGIKIGELIFTSGQLPIDPCQGSMPEGIESQTRQSLLNCKAILEQSGAKMSDIVKTTVFLKDMNDFAAMNEVYKTFFDKDYPCRSAVEVAKLPKNALVEIECIATAK